MRRMEFSYGIACILFAGILNGSFVAPMRKLREWQWENSWFVYSISGLFILPWMTGMVTVPGLTDVLGGASSPTIWRVVLFGLGWGIGSTLFGLGVARMGMAVGYGLTLGLIAPIGTFLPLVVLHPEQLQSKQGVSLIAGTFLVVGGIVLYTIGARMREQNNERSKREFLIGFLICVLAGIFSPMLNFSFAFGDELQQRALAAGASQNTASNAIWPLCLFGGLIANAGYCILLLQRHRTWRLFHRAPSSYWFWSTAMGLICFASFIVYGVGASALGLLGPMVGWPLFISVSLITSNALGWLNGEWKGTPSKAIRYASGGVATLIVAVIVIASGSR